MKPMPFSMASLILVHSHHVLLMLLLLLVSFLPSFLAAAPLISSHHDHCMPSDLQALRSFASSFSNATAILHSSSNQNVTVVFAESWTGPNCCSWAGVTCTTVFTSHNHTHSTAARVSELLLNDLRLSTMRSSYPDILGPLCNLPFLSVLDLQLSIYQALDLYEDGSRVPFPECLADLFSLRKLSLSYWFVVNGTLPSSLSRLHHLQYLDLSHNWGLSGSLLPLTNLPNLTTLSLLGCSFSGTLPPFHNPLLHDLDLSSNSINSTLHDFAFLSNLPSLTSLHLSNNYGLSGSLLPLTNLPSLTTLSLYSCSFSGTLPSSFSRLHHLQYLDLSFNYGLSGSLLPLTNLPNLTTLSLALCSFSGTLPPFHNPLLHDLDLSLNSINSTLHDFTFLSNLPSLTSLNLSGNTNLSGPIPDTITRFSSLKTLRLSGLSLSGTIPNSLCKLTGLIELDLSSNTLVGSTEALTGLTNLIHLDVSNNQFTGPFPRWIRHLHNLEYLDLSLNDFKGALPEKWQSLQKLQTLYLSPNPVTKHPSQNATADAGRIPKWIFRSPKLAHLALGSMNLQSEDLHCSTKLSMLNQSLVELDLSDNLLTGLDLVSCFALHNFTQLSSLSLSNNPLSVSVADIHLTPSIESLDLASCALKGYLTSHTFLGSLDSTRVFDMSLASNNLSGRVPTRMLSNFSQLFSLNLSHNRFDGFDACIQKRGYPVHTIDISNNALVGNLSCALQSLGLPLQNCSLADAVQLYSIDLSHNDLVGGIPASLWRCGQSLRRIKLDNNHLDGQISHELGGDLESLQTLTLNNNKFVGTIPSSIFSRMKSLELLDFSYNSLEGNLHSLFSSFSNLASLRVLLFSHNNISGSIPSSFGNFSLALQLIDLSHNNLTGEIPKDLHLPSFQVLGTMNITAADTLYEEVPQLVIKGNEMNYTYLLKTMTSLDLSSNHLTGPIPPHLGNLSGLQYLNLSHNSLTGSIPASLGKLSVLESLDLSYNKLEGSIPQDLSSLSKLADFNVSFNQALSGRIPTGTQLEGTASYIGDPLLCGSPTLSDCKVGNGSGQYAPNVDPLLKDGKKRGVVAEWMDEWISYAGLSLGFVVGFGVTVWLMLGPPLRCMIPLK